jgi:hypothetical protein
MEDPSSLTARAVRTLSVLAQQNVVSPIEQLSSVPWAARVRGPPARQRPQPRPSAHKASA